MSETGVVKIQKYRLPVQMLHKLYKQTGRSVHMSTAVIWSLLQNDLSDTVVM